MILTRRKPRKSASQAASETIHLNRRRFEGCLTFIDVPSDKAPSGARGHRVILTRAAAEAALDGLIGMAIGFHVDWDQHNIRQRCGVISEATIIENRVLVGGYVFCRDFPDVISRALDEVAPKLGMSYELAEVDVKNMRSSVWTLTRCHFTGAAVLLKTSAAYRNTDFRLLPLGNTPKEEKGLSLGGNLPGESRRR